MTARSQRPTKRKGPPPGRAAGPRPLAPPLPLRHPAVLATAIAAFASVLVSVTFVLIDTDFWQHLLVGKVIWLERSVPTRQLWTWPTYGAPDVNASWGFRALVWPFWSAADVWGLAVWRWLTALASFGLAWATARRMGARGLAPLLVIALCALAYRQRAQIRPETWVAVLLALEIWILESLRHPAASRDPATAPEARPRRLDRALLLVPVAWVWANSHISYHFGLMLIAIHALDAWLAARSAGRHGREAAVARPGRSASRLLALAGIALVVSLINPFGWRALAQPLEYYFVWRGEPIYQLIEELQPFDWRLNLQNFVPLLVAGWTVLLAWRTFRRGLDRVEVMVFVVFTALAVSTSRFIGFYAVVAAPYLGRDLDEWVRSRRWPAAVAAPWTRAAIVGAACLALGAVEWRREYPPFGVGIDLKQAPVAACDFIERHGISGRGFNKFEYGGYQAYRFWPDRERLPFMDIHQAGTRLDRRLYAEALTSDAAWRELDGRYTFDYALLDRPQNASDRIADALDGDTTWALVVWDDASRLYVRRTGRLAPVARRFGASVLPGGLGRLDAVNDASLADSALRARYVADLDSMTRRSAFCASAKSLLANLAAAEGRIDDARRLLTEALAVDPALPRAHERLGGLAMMAGRPEEALAAFRAERARKNPAVPIDFRMALAYQQLGDVTRARSHYRRALAKQPGNVAASDSLRALESR